MERIDKTSQLRGQLRPRPVGSPGLADPSAHSVHSSLIDRDLFVPSSFVFSEELAGLDPFVPL